ncbi:siderophore-interacting protein [Actinomadura graeca]|uniref:Siderophore-interacting protein n=1 Tax=Actinomadura graeca TaxID=2750812 RepID=A0ABX8QXV4_9ACTN|nr:siderophore-interacting protein [Actinomadura graeca]QXJ22287.1 siderophore-interacting protein [Actinomadura graeca]
MIKRRTPETRRPLRTRVLRAERISEHFAVVTVGGPELADFVPMGFDQWCRVFFRREGQRDLRLPTASGNGWMRQCMLMGKATRPWVRNYTVRAFRPEALELDIEIVVHEGGSPGSAFAQGARPGDEVGIFDEGITYLHPGRARQLIVADESAVPAALAILECAPADLEATVFLEVPAASDIRQVRAPAGAEVHWLARGGRGRRPGEVVLDALGASGPPEPPRYAWIAGESRLATGIRRWLTHERRAPRSDVASMGYWRAGRASPG